MTENTMQLVDWLDDLCVRFIINLPREELESVERICFQVEEAQWFYEDFVRPLEPTLPSLNLRQFCLKIFQHCPLFSGYDAVLHSRAFEEFLAYKTRVPVRGAILLNEAMDEVVLVKGWKKSASWSFPRGKINKDEKDIDCAIREVYEETGYDIRAAGLARDEGQVKSIEVTMREQHIKLFVFPNVPRETHFEPRTRKEISKIEWYKLTDLPTLKKSKQQQTDGQDLTKNAHKFYMVAPFMVSLKKYIAHLRKQNGFKLQTTHQSMRNISLETMRDPVRTAQPDVDDMSRLMAQLRQSQQASRENNFPEVSDPADSARNASVHLKTLLNLPGVLAAIPAPNHQVDEATGRESKAQAMLSLLRGEGSGPNGKSPHEPLFEHILGPLEQLSSPSKQSQDNKSQRPAELVPHLFPISSTRQVPQAHPQTGILHKAIGTLLPYKQMSEQTSSHIAFKQRMLPARSTTMTPSWNSDPSTTQGSQFLGDHQTVAPPASRLPIPKLNAHSSALLKLFKPEETAELSRSSQLVQLPAEQLSRPPELSTSRPGTVTQASAAFLRPALQESRHVSSTPASTLPNAALRGSPKASSQQETLLSLFKSPTIPNKETTPTVAALAPVELAATQHTIDPNKQPLRAMRTRDDSSTGQAKLPARNISPLTEDERPKCPVDCDKPEFPPDLSATVTGPLGDLQFVNIQRSPDEKIRTRQQSLKLQGKHVSIQQPIRILPRPGNSYKDIEAIDSGSIDNVSQKQTNLAQGTRPFQPQILKRPTIVSDLSETTMIPTPPNIPQKILSRPDKDHRRPSNQFSNQRASLLALFGKHTSDSPPVMSASALPVSPLSERPALESALPSPLEASRSRIGSIQSFAEETPFTSIQTPKATASPVDKKFLLGFLDGVAKERRN